VRGRVLGATTTAAFAAATAYAVTK
jgi:hypothetical protein